MKILTNEYSCNIPDFKKPAKGGPANFARLFFNFTDKNSKKHLWQGIIFRELDQKNNSYSLSKTKDLRANREIFLFKMPRSFTTAILKANKDGDPRLILSEPISRLSKFIKKISPDIVFLNGFSLGNWIIMEAARLANVPIAVQHAGLWGVELDIYKDFYSPAGIKMMKDMERDVSRFATAEIFLNNFTKEYFDKNILKDKRQRRSLVKVIPLPVELSFFKSRRQKNSRFLFDRKTFHIGIIARWDRIKNHEALADLAQAANKKGLPWLFHSVTKIPDSKKKAALKNKYRRNIDIIGHLTKEDIKEFCSSNDLMIVPSKFDVSPTTLLEALACGTPTAISKNVGFVDDYKKHGAKDWIVDFDNPDKAIRQIKKILRKKIPVKLINELERKHDSKKILKEYLSLFQEITKK
jgi:glycosyltransferase involved in cell wall biosynthesis